MRLIILAGCLSMGLWSALVLAVDDKQVQQSIELAKAAFEKAVAEQSGWMSTKKLISSAELSVTKGDKNKALQLADKARREAELSYQQALNQKKEWAEPSYLK